MCGVLFFVFHSFIGDGEEGEREREKEGICDGLERPTRAKGLDCFFWEGELGVYKRNLVIADDVF